MATTTPLSDGGYVSSWLENTGSAQLTLHVQKYSAGGAAVGPEFTATHQSNLQTTVTALDNGGYVVVYGTALRGYYYNAAVFDDDGANVRTMDLPGAAAGYDIAASSLGGFVVHTQEIFNTSGGPNYSGYPLLTFYDDTGAVVAGPARLSGSDWHVAAQPDGHYAISWTDGDIARSLDVDPTHLPDLSKPPRPTDITVIDDSGALGDNSRGAIDDVTPTLKVAVSQTGWLQISTTTGDTPEDGRLLGGMRVTAQDVARGYVEFEMPRQAAGASTNIFLHFKSETGVVSDTAVSGGVFTGGAAIMAVTDDVGVVTGGVPNYGHTDDATPTLRLNLADSAAHEGSDISVLDLNTVVAHATVTTADLARGYIDLTTSQLTVGGHLLTPRVDDYYPSHEYRLIVGAPSAPPAGGGSGPATLSVAGGGSHPEGASGVTDFGFTITRSGDSSGEAAVDYYVWSDQADAGDFSGATAGTARFAAGETSVVVHVGAVGDTAIEPDETFHLSLSNARGAAIATGTADAVIVNDDSASSGGTGGGGSGGGSAATGFSITGPSSFLEGNSGSTQLGFTVTRTGDLSAAGAVDYFVWGDQTNASDFSGPTAGTAYFAAGVNAVDVRVDVAGDTTVENDEAFNISLANGRGADIAAGTFTAVIRNDDSASTPPDDGGHSGGSSFAIGGPGALNEGDNGVSDFVFTVTRSGDVSGSGAVDYWVWSDETDSLDFSGATAGTAYFQAGQTTAQVHIGVMGDTAVEGDEAFQVSIANARGGAITTDTGGAIIHNDDGQASGGSGTGSGAAEITISGGGQVSEPDAGSAMLSFTVARSGAAAGAAAVDWWVWGDTSGSDFSGATAGTAYFADGEASKVIQLSVASDTTAEPDEAFHLSLANARGASLGGVTTADGVILHNDGWLV